MNRTRRNLLASLLAVYNDFDEASPAWRVSAYLLRRFGELGTLSTREVMDACDVTRPELRQVAAALGLAEFSDVRQCRGEWGLFREYFLGFAATGGDASQFRAELDGLYDAVDTAMESPMAQALCSSIHDARKVVLLTTDASVAVLHEFQRAMVMEGQLIRLVGEADVDEGVLDDLDASDLLLVVSTSGGLVKRVLDTVSEVPAYRVLVSACDDDLVQTPFDDALLMGHAMAEGEPLHRMFATYGVAYFFDRVLSAYAATYDPDTPDVPTAATD